MASRVPAASQFAVYGPTFLDVVMGPLDGPPVPGREAWVEGALMCAGGAANQAIALARLGAPVRLHSRVGVDQMGVFVDEMLAREGVDTSSCERVGDQNVTVSLSFDGDRAMTTRGTTALPLLGGDAPGCLLADARGIGANSEVVSSWRPCTWLTCVRPTRRRRSPTRAPTPWRTPRGGSRRLVVIAWLPAARMV